MELTAQTTTSEALASLRLKDSSPSLASLQLEPVNLEVVSSPTPASSYASSLPSQPSPQEQRHQQKSPTSGEKAYFCQRCLNHGEQHPRKGHKPACKWAHCRCEKCSMVEQRRVYNGKLNPKKLSSCATTGPEQGGEGGSKAAGPKKRDPKCAMCLVHGKHEALKGHKKRECPFMRPIYDEPPYYAPHTPHIHAECLLCQTVLDRRELMAKQIKLRRYQKKEREGASGCHSPLSNNGSSSHMPDGGIPLTMDISPPTSIVPDEPMPALMMGGGLGGGGGGGGGFSVPPSAGLVDLNGQRQPPPPPLLANFGAETLLTQQPQQPQQQQMDRFGLFNGALKPASLQLNSAAANLQASLLQWTPPTPESPISPCSLGVTPTTMQQLAAAAHPTAMSAQQMDLLKSLLAENAISRLLLNSAGINCGPIFSTLASTPPATATTMGGISQQSALAQLYLCWLMNNNKQSSPFVPSSL